MKKFENKFFRQITLRLCSDIKIENALFACLQYFKSYLPADLLVLQFYQADLGSHHLIASATSKTRNRLDIAIPFSTEATKVVEARLDIYKKTPDVIISNDTEKDPMFRPILNFFKLEQTSALTLVLGMGDVLLGSLALYANGRNCYTREHARLFGLLKEPFSITINNLHITREINRLRELLEDDKQFLQQELLRVAGDRIIGEELGLREVMDNVRHVAAHDSPVLLSGETGTGKDVIAQAIHNASARKFGPFITVNCGAIPDTLIDSELFGHEKGAFTGAMSQKRGRFERADKGTIFLDEVGEMPLQAQVRLLRVLQNKVIERVGGHKPIQLDIRVIAATNKNLEQMVKSQLFRQDLWFRLNVFPIRIPALRERKQDIPNLVQYFIQKKGKDLKLTNFPIPTAKAVDQLASYHWPGNIRELENLIERELILNPTGPLEFDHLPVDYRKVGAFDSNRPGDAPLKISTVMANHICHVLKLADGKIHGEGGAADLMGINPSTLRGRMDKLGIPYGREIQKNKHIE
jgi:formate hydrogenlyase transcriptional activator